MDPETETEHATAPDAPSSASTEGSASASGAIPQSAQPTQAPPFPPRKRGRPKGSKSRGASAGARGKRAAKKPRGGGPSPASGFAATAPTTPDDPRDGFDSADDERPASEPGEPTGPLTAAQQALQIAAYAPVWFNVTSMLAPIAAAAVRNRTGVDMNAVPVRAFKHVEKGGRVATAPVQCSATEALAIALSEVLALYVPMSGGDHPMGAAAMTAVGIVMGVAGAAMRGGTPAPIVPVPSPVNEPEPHVDPVPEASLVPA